MTDVRQLCSGRVVAVTGASGFLGAHVAAALDTAGAKIRILTHDRPPHMLWRDLPVKMVAGSITDKAICAELAAGADAVVHSAGLIKTTLDAAFFEINALGTAIMAQAVRDTSPVCRFVLISSLAAREPGLSPYAASKRAGELAAQAVFSDMPERLVILRPPVIYGPWDQETFAFFKTACRRVAPVFGTARNAIIHVQDAADAITQVAMGAGNAGCYALSGPDLAAYTIRELIMAAALAVGANPLLVPVPATILQAAGIISGWQARGRGVAQIFTAGKAREMLHPDWTVRLDEALPLNISQPAIDLQEGFRQTAEWYKLNGWLLR